MCPTIGFRVNSQPLFVLRNQLIMTLFDKLVTFYKNVNWEMVKVPNETIISTTYGGDNGQWVFVATSDEPNGIIVLFSRAPEPCPPEKYAVMSEFLERANFGMTHGAWVMDRKDGEIRYRVGVDMGDMELTDTYLRDLTLYTNLTMDRYLPGLRSVLFKDKNAQQAYSIVFP